MLKSIIIGSILAAILIMTSCSKTATNSHPQLIFKFVYDSTQVRLNAFGQPEAMPSGHAGQNPHLNVMSAHYIEMAQYDTDSLGKGTILYMTPNSTAGGSSAIDFSQEVLTPNNSIFYQRSLDSVTPGTYKWLRVSLAYQNFDAQLYVDTTYNYNYNGTNIPVVVNQEFPCTVASFVGSNTYISSYTVKSQSVAVNANKLQGYWGFESSGTITGSYLGYPYSYPFNYITQGQAPVGATTVVNPLFASSPIPAGSCVATGQFASETGNSTAPLIITGHETSDIVVVVSLSVNKSFEWIDVHQDGKWEPSKGENIVDMGIRGLIPKVKR
ncbi:MAG: hypothetical protein JWO03_2666 [Bacteroidetes bacterium]|nr:hypothetical protein [Bacteroidota bacterium]